MRRLTQRTEAVVNLRALEHNINNIRSRLGSGVEAVTADKRRRVRNAARAYCLRKGCADAVCRFDILEFSRAGVQYLKNAF